MSSERSLKRKLSYCSARDGNGSNSNSDSGKVYKFQIQLPDGLTTHLALRDPPEQMQVSEFIGLVRKELEKVSNGSESMPRSGSNKREIRWNPHMYLEDVFGKKIASAVPFSRFAPNNCHILVLHEDFEDSTSRYYKVHTTQVPKIELGSPHTPKKPHQYCQLASSPMSCWSNKSFQAYLRTTQKLEQEVEKIALKVGCLERSVSEFLDKKKGLENDISILKAKLGNSYERHINTLESTKETMKQEIEQLCQGTMASVLVEFSKRPIPNFNLKNELKADCDNLVALLATVTDPKLSRVLAKYLGEELMLSVACDTDGSRSFVQYDSNGEINKTYGIYRVASILGIAINKPFSVINLDKVRPYVGDMINEGVQKKLAIPHPYSPQHQTSLEGFVGYAVNLLNFTKENLGLRATLFYELFGQLQVYRTRYDIERAHDYIKEGAVSLDGAIVRSNGIFSHGDTKEPKITFAVVEPLSEGTSDENVIDIITQIKKKNDILENLQPAYERVLQMQHDVLKEFKRKYDHFQMIVQNKSLETSIFTSDICK